MIGARYPKPATDKTRIFARVVEHKMTGSSFQAPDEFPGVRGWKPTPPRRFITLRCANTQSLFADACVQIEVTDLTEWPVGLLVDAEGYYG